MTWFSPRALGAVLATLVYISAAPARAGITYQTVAVGNAGNGSDTTTGAGTYGFGSVAYDYQIGKYDVTIGQYTAFLNAVAATDTYSLYNAAMAANGNVMGIQQAGASGSHTYSMIGSADRPVTYVSWFDAARFANWMTNGQGGSTTTETGAYTLHGAVSGDAVAANVGAAFSMPTENEWYKAAYYSPNYGGGGVGGYFSYATQSNSAPGNQVGSTPNQANWLDSVFAVTQSAGYSSSQNYLTNVGAFSGSASYFGTFDQSGNVFQWNDLSGATGSLRGLRGGDWYGNATDASSSYRGAIAPSTEGFSIGFRLASPTAIPELDPATGAGALSLAAGVLAIIEQRRRRASQAVGTGQSPG